MYSASRREMYAIIIHARLDKDSFMAILQKAILTVNTVNRLKAQFKRLIHKESIFFETTCEHPVHFPTIHQIHLINPTKPSRGSHPTCPQAIEWRTRPSSQSLQSTYCIYCQYCFLQNSHKAILVKPCMNTICILFPTTC